MTFIDFFKYLLRVKSLPSGDLDSWQWPTQNRTKRPSFVLLPVMKNIFKRAVHPASLQAMNHGILNTKGCKITTNKYNKQNIPQIYQKGHKSQSNGKMNIKNDKITHKTITKRCKLPLSDAKLQQRDATPPQNNHLCNRETQTTTKNNHKETQYNHKGAPKWPQRHKMTIKD